MYALHNNYPRATDNVHRRPLISARARHPFNENFQRNALNFYRFPSFIDFNSVRRERFYVISLFQRLKFSPWLRSIEARTKWPDHPLLDVVGEIGVRECSTNSPQVRHEPSTERQLDFHRLQETHGKEKDKETEPIEMAARENPASFRVNDRVHINYPVVARAFLRAQRRSFVVNPQFTETKPTTFDLRGNGSPPIGCQRSIKLNRKEEKNKSFARYARVSSDPVIILASCCRSMINSYACH